MMAHAHSSVCAGIDYKLNTTVTKTDLKSKTLSTSNGDDLKFEKLIIATGCVVGTHPAVCLVEAHSSPAANT